MTHYLKNHYRIKHHESLPSPVHGTVHHVVFDVNDWVYRELLSEILEEGYELLAFGVTDDGDPKAVLREEETHLGPSESDRFDGDLPDERLERFDEEMYELLGDMRSTAYARRTDQESFKRYMEEAEKERTTDLRDERKALFERLAEECRVNRTSHPLIDTIETTPTWEPPIDQQIEAYLRDLTNPVYIPPSYTNWE